MSSAYNSFHNSFDSHEPRQELDSPFLNEEFLVEEARTAQLWKTLMPELQPESPFLEAFEEGWGAIRESEFEPDQQEWEREAITDYTPAEEGQLPLGQSHKFLTDSRELLIYLSRLVFFARYPELEQPGGTGCRCNPVQRADRQLTEAQKRELEDIKDTIVQPILTQGTDENQLTNLVFCTRHPQLPDCKIPEQDETLRQEWTCIRNSCIRPVLAKTFNQWLRTVDKVVRKQFGLTGVGLAGRVKFVTQTQFAKQLLATDIPELLLNLFLNPPRPTVIIKAILRFHHQGDLLEGIRDEKRMQRQLRKLREFIAERIKVGNFQSAVAPPVNPKKIKTLAASPGGIVTITPAEIVAMFTSGLTKMAATRSGRTILIQMHSEVEVLVHEACHFYMHNQFRIAAEKANNRFFNGLRLSEILLEGFPEFFTRQAMQVNEKELGRLHVEAYQDYVEAAGRFITTIEDKAKGSARKAFFDGNSAAINLLFRAIELNIKNHPLLVPGFMLEQAEFDEVGDELNEAEFPETAEELEFEEFFGEWDEEEFEEEFEEEGFEEEGFEEEVVWPKIDDFLEDGAEILSNEITNLNKLSLMDDDFKTEVLEDKIIGFDAKLSNLNIQLSVNNDGSKLPESIPIEVAVWPPGKPSLVFVTRTLDVPKAGGSASKGGTILYKLSVLVSDIDKLLMPIDKVKEVATVRRIGGTSDMKFVKALGSKWKGRGQAEQAHKCGIDSGSLTDERPDALKLLQSGGVAILEIKIPSTSFTIKRFIRNPADVFYYTGHGLGLGFSRRVVAATSMNCLAIEDHTSADGYCCWAKPSDISPHWKSPMDLDVFIIAGCSVLAVDASTGTVKGDGLEWAKLLKSNGGPLIALLGYGDLDDNEKGGPTGATAPLDNRGGDSIAQEMGKWIKDSSNFNGIIEKWLHINASVLNFQAIGMDEGGWCWRTRRKSTRGWKLKKKVTIQHKKEGKVRFVIEKIKI
jgi:hypothetical protein